MTSLPCGNSPKSTANSDAYLFKPEAAYRVRRSTNPDTPIPPDEPAGQNPPDGAILDYFLAQPASGPVTLEIVDAQGKLVRRYSSTDKPEVSQAELEKQLDSALLDAHAEDSFSKRRHAPLGLGSALSLAYCLATRVSDFGRALRYSQITARPTRVARRIHCATHREWTHLHSAAHGKDGSAGKHATCRTSNNNSHLEMRLASELTASTEAVTQAHSVLDQLHKIGTQSKGALAESIKALDQKVGTILRGPTPAVAGTAPEPTLTRANAAVSTLYGALDRPTPRRPRLK